ncbi:MAG: RNA polymerase sigma factor [Solimonas sp.]
MNLQHDALPVQPSLLSSLVRHYDELVDYVRLRFGDRSFAHEVVHDVCVQILERPEREAQREPVRVPLALLRRISHDAAVDRCRAEDLRRTWVDTVAVLPETACPVAGQERALDAEQELERLAQAIAALPLRRRQVFVMHKLHELPQAEVAARLGISLKMVEKQLRLGMAACRERLGYERCGHEARHGR